MSESKKFGKLYLIPNVLSDDNGDDFIPEMVKKMVHHIDRFVVENEKDARALIKKLKLEKPQSELKFWKLDEHTPESEIGNLLEALENGLDAGIITDAGLPCIADPGSLLVALAHRKKIEVIPLPGSSSILLTLMGSGLNGQNFAFNGYIPVDKAQRAKKIQFFEQLALKGQTQIFMEAPYRNNALLADVLQNCKPNIRLCIGCDLTSKQSFIQTKTISEWKKELPDLHKKPVIFIIGV
ncbi:MAG: SAM-dependent methyltransferase [Bacteroidia bacterium]